MKIKPLPPSADAECGKGSVHWMAMSAGSGVAREAPGAGAGWVRRGGDVRGGVGEAA
jgi:hypothetical protein